MTDRDDAEIWAGVCAGRAEDCGLVWDRHRDRVFRYLLSQGNDRWSAEDLAAVVFLELWRRRRSVRFVDGSMLPWLLVTSKNVSRNSTRSTRRYAAVLARLPDPAHTLSADAHIPAASDLAEIRAALADRDPSDSSLLEMVTAGTRMDDAGAALGISEAAAKMRLSRLRAHLRARIAESPAEGR